jgi:hypothetical protein
MRVVAIALSVALASAVLPSFLFAEAAQAAGKRSLERRLPRNYIGHFHWDNKDDQQAVEFRFDIVRRVDARSVEALGCGRYDASGIVTNIEVEMHISMPDLAVELVEREPEGSPGFTVNGSHIGSLSRDLKHLTAVWTTGATGERGKIDLQAGGTLSCSSALAR